MFGWVVGKQEVDQKWAERRSMVIRPKKTSGQRQVSHPLRRDSGRSSNRNRHLSPSVNTSRLPITNRKWRAPAVATNGYGRERIGSKKDNLRGERRSSGRRPSYRSRYGRLRCTDMKFSPSIQFSQSRM